nr:hypothetical protein [Micromonospora sp. DSM 115978]
MALDPASPVWQQALAGRAGWSPAVEVEGTDRVYVVVPVVQDGATVAVLVIGRSSADGLPSVFLRSLAPLGRVSYVDAGGVATFSSDPAAAGERLVDPAELAPVKVGEAVRVTDGTDPDLVSNASPLASLPGNYT